MTNDLGPSLKDLQILANTSRPQQINLGLLLFSLNNNPYEVFVDLVEDAIDWVLQQLARNPELKQDLSEDQLTAEIILALTSLGFDASHDTKIGGHCDLVIEAKKECLWLGEAKIFHGGYDWILKGFEQLNSRYSTGSTKQDHGGIIVYIREARVKEIMDNWEKHLISNKAPITTKPCERNPAAFRSEHTHERSGPPYHIRHVPVSLFFDPKDSVRKVSDKK